MINTIIFDFAGVVTKTNFLPVLIKECEEKLGLDGKEFKRLFIENEEPFMLGQMSCKDFWQIACQGYDIPYEKFAAVFSNAYEINPAMVDLLKKLKEKYLVVMLSDNFDGLAQSIHNNAALAGLFKHIFLSNEIRLAKKTPGCFEHVLKELGKTPDECLFTDDKEENLKPAMALGINTIHFTDVDNFKTELRQKGIQI